MNAQINKWHRRDVFTSITDALECAKQRGTTWGKVNTGGNDDWAGGSWKDTERYITNGWAEGAHEASAIATRIADRLATHTAESLNIEAAYDVCGAAYDVGGYLAGVPDCWVRPQEQRAKRAIHICINIIASCGVGVKALKTRGIAMAALAMALTAIGHPLTIDVCQVVETCRGYEATTVRVADASTGSQLDLDRLVYAMAHPTMLRRLFKAIVGHVEWNPSTVISDAKPEDTEYDLFIGGVHLNEVERWHDGGEAWVLAEFNRQTQG